MKILLVGGGSGGPVTPLIAVAEEITKTHSQAKFLLVGTKTGPEKHMAQKAGIAFMAISAGKLRRYFSVKNLGSPFLTLAGFFESFKILNNFKPDCVFGTGSFVQVPLIWAARLYGIPVVLHQQDIELSLANKLCQLAADKITVSFAANLKSFVSSLGLFYKKNSDKIIFTGNPFRQELRNGNKERGLKSFNLKTDLPTLLVLGGGTGAQFLNGLVTQALPQLCKSVQIIHSTGEGKFQKHESQNYRPYEFIDNMADAYAAADIVLARAGLSTITELSNLKKLSIIVPMPDSHQEFNALYLAQKDAAVILSQKHITPEGFTNLIRKLIFAHQAQTGLTANMAKIMPHDASQKISEIILKLAEK